MEGIYFSDTIMIPIATLLHYFNSNLFDSQLRKVKTKRVYNEPSASHLEASLYTFFHECYYRHLDGYIVRPQGPLRIYVISDRVRKLKVKIKTVLSHSSKYIEVTRTS